MRNAAERVQAVSEAQPRVAQRHARSCVTHDVLCLFAARPFVAMNRAIRAGGFFLPVGTLRKPLAGVGKKFLAVGARLLRRPLVISRAINFYHCLHRAVLAPDSAERLHVLQVSGLVLRRADTLAAQYLNSGIFP